jgi:type VI secretion system protein ImpA
VARFEANPYLLPVNDSAPCGENPEYSDSYQRLETAAQGEQESQFSAGTEPDWREVEEAALAVLGEARELRTLGYLCLSYLNRGDWFSFSEATKAIAGLLEGFWECVHPQIDSDGDATERINAVENLAHPSMLLGMMRNAPLIDAKGLGRFSVRDVAVALGKMEPHAGDEPPDVSLINAAVSSMEPETIVATHESLQAAQQALNASSRIFAERLSASDAPDLDPVLHLLDLCSGFLQPFLPHDTADSAAGDGELPEGAVEGRQAALSGSINGRNDVVRWIDRICEYYAKNEPSSPVPILMRRARDLVHKSFPEILADLMPDAAGQFSIFEGSTGASGGDDTSNEESSNW